MNLPPTSDKEFWLGENYQTAVGEPQPAKDHYLEVHGPWVICTSCPYRHTVTVDLKKYDIKDGSIVLKDRKVVK